MWFNRGQNICRNHKWEYLKWEFSLNILTTEPPFSLWIPCMHKVSWVMVSCKSCNWWQESRSSLQPCFMWHMHYFKIQKISHKFLQISSFSLKNLKIWQHWLHRPAWEHFTGTECLLIDYFATLLTAPYCFPLSLLFLLTWSTGLSRHLNLCSLVQSYNPLAVKAPDWPPSEKG